MEFLNEYMIPVVVGICLYVGYICKNLIATKTINRWIPAIVSGVGVFISIWLNSWVITPEVILGGLVSGLASTGMHQLLTQFINKN